MWALFKTYLKNRSESELILVLIFRLLAVLYSQDSPTLVCHAHSLLAYSSIFPFYTKLDREKYIVQGTDLLVLVSEKQFLLNHQVLLQLFSQLLGLWCDIHLVCQIPNDEGGFSWAPCHACSQTDIFLNGFVKLRHQQKTLHFLSLSKLFSGTTLGIFLSFPRISPIGESDFLPLFTFF